MDSDTTAQIDSHSLGDIPIFQVHPTRICNLSCQHCYSNSGPRIREELDPDLVCCAIRDAAAIGYRVVSVSGGEPFMYPALVDLLKCAKSFGMRTTVTTNAFFLEPKNIRAVRDHVDLIGVSCDGPPEVHNRIRGSRQAFNRLTKGLGHLHASGLDFGIIHTLTRESWEYLICIAQFCAESGARLFQIHPLERAGRAERSMRADSFTDDDINARAYLLSVALATRYVDQMMVHIDLLHREQVLRNPELILGMPLGSSCPKNGSSAGGAEARQMPRPSDLAKLMRILVLESDGTIVPVAYGFSRHYAVCNIRRQPLSECWPRYIADGYGAFDALCRATFGEIAQNNHLNLFNWHELILSRSHIPDSGRRIGVYA